MWTPPRVNTTCTKMVLVTLCLLIMMLSGYYEYILSVTLASNKHSSSIHLNFTANTLTFSNQEPKAKEREIKNQTIPSCQAVPKGRHYYSKFNYFIIRSQFCLVR